MIDCHEHLKATDTCVVAFASGGGEFSAGLPHFEFGNSLEAMGVSYVLMRDSTGFSCQYGITGIGDRDAVCRYVDRLMALYPRVMTIGLSVGAMAALMYGQLVSVHEMVVLSPFTSLGGNPDAVFGADWRARCPFRVDVPLLIDLTSIFPRGPCPRTTAYISNGPDTEQDRFHAERIGITNITLIPGASHSGLGKLMRDNGMLQKAITG